VRRERLWHRLQPVRDENKWQDCHSEARFAPKNLSVFPAIEPREILRYAQNDRNWVVARDFASVPLENRQRGGIFFRLLFFLFVLGFLALSWAVRHPLMRFAGEFWVVDESLTQSDALIVLSDDNYSGDRAFRAAELYRQGIAPVVVASGRMLRQNASVADLIEHDLESFGVPAAYVVKLTHRADNTKDEAAEVAKLVDARHWKRIMIVTSNYHARRARFIYGRTLPSVVTFRVSGARDSEFDPTRWWQTRRGQKLFFTELAGYIVARWELRAVSSPGNGASSIVFAVLAAGSPQVASGASNETDIHIEMVTFPEQRYQLILRYPNIFSCDPDVYPIARIDGERNHGIQNFAKIVSDRTGFQAMAKHLRLDKVTDFSDEQKVAIYREYKKLTAITLESQNGKIKFIVRVLGPMDKGTGISIRRITGFIDPSGDVTIQDSVPELMGCPVCLAAGTRIDTPSGRLEIQDLKPGVRVWTLNARSERIAMPVLRVSAVSAPPSHMMVHLFLNDGRELIASPGHPTVDGREVGQLQAGEAYDGAAIRLVRIEPYRNSYQRTFDILPAGDTGFYWANGILMASTLH
jgi:uncharacterized SAM-binding protein YcdF (DUF218 family)